MLLFFEIDGIYQHQHIINNRTPTALFTLELASMDVNGDGWSNWSCIDTCGSPRPSPVTYSSRSYTIRIHTKYTTYIYTTVAETCWKWWRWCGLRWKWRDGVWQRNCGNGSTRRYRGLRHKLYRHNINLLSTNSKTIHVGGITWVLWKTLLPHISIGIHWYIDTTTL